MKRNNTQRKKKRLGDKCLRLWTEILLNRANNRCEICGQEANQVHHYIKKSQSNILKYDLDNGIPLCVKHHFLIHYGQEAELNAEIVKNRGFKWHNKLIIKKKIITKNSITWYQENIERLEEER